MLIIVVRNAFWVPKEETTVPTEMSEQGQFYSWSQSCVRKVNTLRRQESHWVFILTQVVTEPLPYWPGSEVTVLI